MEAFRGQPYQGMRSFDGGRLREQTPMKSSDEPRFYVAVYCTSRPNSK